MRTCSENLLRRRQHLVDRGPRRYAKSRVHKGTRDAFTIRLPHSGSARNRISKTLDGKVIEENFEQDAGDSPPILRGHSISVLQQSSGIWQQAWADNQGGYFSFSASIDGDKRIFATALLSGADNSVRGQRMVFYDIRPDSFSWDWEGTRDGGKSWSLLWRLRYVRQ